MKTSFDTWLAELAAAGLGGSALTESDIPAATRGIPWSMQVWLAGDFSGYTMSCSISAAPDAASPLTTPTVGTATYSSSTGYTVWGINLGGAAVAALPADTDGDGVEAFPMMFRLTPSGGNPFTLFGGAFVVLGKA
ncbi:hypothetical protein [Novosphingobium sp.]|uniref:hypothetical protein n=1 Tax=Novosphingobium sp. TaxID=1874826 RepID=UPI0038BD3309